MGWFYLILAGLCEIGFTTFLQLSNGFNRVLPTILFAILAAFSFIFLALSLKYIPLGTSYAVWTGIGAFGTAIIGVVYFGESTDPKHLFFLFCLITSII